MTASKLRWAELFTVKGYHVKVGTLGGTVSFGFGVKLIGNSTVQVDFMRHMFLLWWK